MLSAVIDNEYLTDIQCLKTLELQRSKEKVLLRRMFLNYFTLF